MIKPQEPKDIGSYMRSSPPACRRYSNESGKRFATPEAKEPISYTMPAFRRRGMLDYFAAWEKHIGLYPPVCGSKSLEKATARYAGPKGNFQFPLDRKAAAWSAG